MLLELCRAWCCAHFLREAVPVPSHSLSEEPFPNVEPEPPQPLDSISLCPITGHQRSSTSPPTPLSRSCRLHWAHPSAFSKLLVTVQLFTLSRSHCRPCPPLKESKVPSNLVSWTNLMYIQFPHPYHLRKHERALALEWSPAEPHWWLPSRDNHIYHNPLCLTQKPAAHPTILRGSSSCMLDSLSRRIL